MLSTLLLKRKIDEFDRAKFVRVRLEESDDGAVWEKKWRRVIWSEIVDFVGGGGGVGATKPGRYNGVYAKEMSINARIQSARDRSTQKRARTHYIFRIVNFGLSAFIRKVFRSLSASSDISV